MNALTKSQKTRAFITQNMTDLITFPDKNVKSAVSSGGYINGIYRYIKMIVSPTTFTPSVQRSNRFCVSSSSNNDAATLQLVIAALCMRQKIICECCEIIGHKADGCIIGAPKFLPISLRRDMNQFNTLHGYKPKAPPKEWNSQPPEAHFKSRSSLSRNNPIIAAIIPYITDTIPNLPAAHCE